MASCAIKPEDQRKQVRLVGNDLVKNYGKKKYYSAQEVKDANRRQGIDIDLYCWSHAVFNSHGVFDAYHESIGESCNLLFNPDTCQRTCRLAARTVCLAGYRGDINK